MNIFLALVLFIIGIVFVVKGGDWFVDSASWMARAAHIPPLIIGATIVSFATTLPELIVSVIASLDGLNDMAVGNAVGSVSANTGLIMAIAIVFMSITAPRRDYLIQSILLPITALVLFLGCIKGFLSAWASIVLFLIFVLFMANNVTSALKKMKNGEDEEEEDIKKDGKTITKNIILFIVGAALIVLGSNLLIKGGSAIAEAIGIPERIIAITMVAIGTSLPELVTTITAVKKKQAHLSIGNIIGANIIDLSLILPICSLVSKGSFAVSPLCIKFDMPICLALTVIATLPLLIKERAYKAQGILLFVVYISYLVVSSL